MKRIPSIALYSSGQWCQWWRVLQRASTLSSVGSCGGGAAVAAGEPWMRHALPKFTASNSLIIITHSFFFSMTNTISVKTSLICFSALPTKRLSAELISTVQRRRWKKRRSQCDNSKKKIEKMFHLCELFSKRWLPIKSFTYRGCNSSRESRLGNKTEDSTSSEAEVSTKRDGSRNSSPLHVLTITRWPWWPLMLRLSNWYCGLPNRRV